MELSSRSRMVAILTPYTFFEVAKDPHQSQQKMPTDTQDTTQTPQTDMVVYIAQTLTNTPKKVSPRPGGLYGNGQQGDAQGPSIRLGCCV